MSQNLVDAGYLFRNGHGRCGGCRSIEDRTPGGRRARKLEGWTYDAGRLGWVCPTCSRWARSSSSSSSSSVRSNTPTTVSTELSTIRGFGLKTTRSPLKPAIAGRRRRNAARRRHHELELRSRGEAIAERPKNKRKGRPTMTKKTRPGPFVSWSSSTD